ncbi:MAG: hypothetical protein J7497_00270 [Chitinophagaceae bacterium]|nr:hypothetical protein [Chitinophagaceae bacterium]
MDNFCKIVWIFSGSNSRFPSGAFSAIEIAENWIQNNKLTGVLTSYPIDISVYDWAIKNEFFVPRNDTQKSSDFIQKFSSGSQEHYHYENGLRE